MLRSLHMKLVMIMVLLIMSLMMVVGAFLINSVTAFYLEDFYSQMSTVFGDPLLLHDLTTPSDGEEDGAEQLSRVLDAYAGELGVDNRNRKLYILDSSGVPLVSPDGEEAALETELNNVALALELWNAAGSAPAETAPCCCGAPRLDPATLKDAAALLRGLTRCLPLFHDIRGSLDRDPENPFDLVELFEIKHFLVTLEQLTEAYAKLPPFQNLAFIRQSGITVRIYNFLFHIPEQLFRL